MLKSRFGGGCEFKYQIARVNKWIKVCIILYDMFRPFDDEWDDEEPEDVDEPEVEEEPNFATFYGFN